MDRWIRILPGMLFLSYGNKQQLYLCFCFCFNKLLFKNYGTNLDAIKKNCGNDYFLSYGDQNYHNKINKLFYTFQW